jgi:asparagine synthase (glutamine-hydrolysing)
MCGIAAFFSNDKSVSAQALNRATKALHHRGPDNQSIWLSPNQRVGLGHARLSIIDLTTGDQPIANEDERIHIIVNGEFYDFERQRRDLEQRGHRFRTGSDSEIALHLHEDFGVQCVEHLRGEFAFVLWDETNQTLFAARDRFGIKPLYYAVHDGTVFLASEIKALFAAGVPAHGPRIFLSARDRPGDARSHALRRRASGAARYYLLRPRTACGFCVTGNFITASGRA